MLIALENPGELCRQIKENRMRVGVALKPATPASSVFHLVETKAVDMVLVMTVEPGFGGQAFMDSCMPKVIIHFTD